MDVMLDIETLGTEPGCVVLSIGAVEFNDVTLGREFYVNIDKWSCRDHGLTVDKETKEWWQRRSDEAQHVLEGGVELDEALEKFTAWYDGGAVWANAPSFDCMILRSAYDAIDMEEPWEYYDQRCYRTLTNVHPMTAHHDGRKHHALDDAKHQAKVASKILKSL